MIYFVSGMRSMQVFSSFVASLGKEQNKDLDLTNKMETISLIANTNIRLFNTLINVQLHDVTQCFFVEILSPVQTALSLLKRTEVAIICTVHFALFISAGTAHLK